MSDTIEYRGMVYVRPCGRGIQLLEAPGSGESGEGALSELDGLLDHGHYRAEIRFVRVPEAEVDGVSK